VVKIVKKMNFNAEKREKELRRGFGDWLLFPYDR